MCLRFTQVISKIEKKEINQRSTVEGTDVYNTQSIHNWVQSKCMFLVNDENIHALIVYSNYLSWYFRMFKVERNVVHGNLAFALLASQLVFLTGIDAIDNVSSI